jgi:hypothetical protein
VITTQQALERAAITLVEDGEGTKPFFGANRGQKLKPG